MGVHGLWRLLDGFGKVTRAEEWRGRRVAIDASIWIVQFTAQVGPNESEEQKVLEGFLVRILKLLFHGILPVFVFDGPSSIAKQGEKHRRQQRREALEHAYLQRRARQIVMAQVAAGQLSVGTLTKPEESGDKPAQLNGNVQEREEEDEDANDDDKSSAPVEEREDNTSDSESEFDGDNDGDDDDDDNSTTSPAEEPSSPSSSSPSAPSSPASSREAGEAAPPRRRRRRRRVLAPDKVSASVTTSFLADAEQLIKERSRLSEVAFRNQLRNTANSLFMGPREVFGESRPATNTAAATTATAPAKRRRVTTVVDDSDSDVVEATPPVVAVDSLGGDDTDSVVSVEEVASKSATPQRKRPRRRSNSLSVWLTKEEEDDRVGAENDLLAVLSTPPPPSLFGAARTSPSPPSASHQRPRRHPQGHSCDSVPDSTGAANNRAKPTVAADEDSKAEENHLRLHDGVMFGTGPTWCPGTQLPPPGTWEAPAALPAVPTVAVSPTGKAAEQAPAVSSRAAAPPPLGHRAATSVPYELLPIAELLDSCGVPFVLSPAEADAQCAFLCAAGLVDGVFTEDSDVLVHGAPVVLRGFFARDRQVVEYRQSELRACGLSKPVLVALAVLLGCDYTEGVAGVGLAGALPAVAAAWDRTEATEAEETAAAADGSAAEERMVLALLRRLRAAVAGEGDERLTLVQLALAEHLRGRWASAVFPPDFPSPSTVAAFYHAEVNRDRTPFSRAAPDWRGLRALAGVRGLLRAPWVVQLFDLAQRTCEEAEAAARETQRRLEDFGARVQTYEKSAYRKVPPAHAHTLHLLRQLQKGEKIEKM